MELNVDAWMNELKSELLEEFGDRLVLLGLQGSRARGEARPDSDIDIVLVVDLIDVSTLENYKKVLSRMQRADLACGFVGSPEILAAWPRYDSFNLVMDTNLYYGSFGFMDTNYTVSDAIDAARAGASVIYHAICHGLLFNDESLRGIESECVKSAFFVMRAMAYSRTGEYPATRERMKELTSENERAFLMAYDQPDSMNTEELARRLLAWSAAVLAGDLD